MNYRFNNKCNRQVLYDEVFVIFNPQLGHLINSHLYHLLSTMMLYGLILDDWWRRKGK